MKHFTYTIQDEVGLHARPAGLLAKEAQKYKAKIVLEMDGKQAELTRLMAVMGMGIRKGDVIHIFVEGEDEAIAAKEMERFFQAHL